MRVNLRLSQQGLLLVGVPVGLMLIFLLCLLLLLLRVEREAEDADHSKNIISEANALVKEYYDAASQLILYKYTRSDNARQKFEEQLAGTKNSFKELERLLKDDPDELKMLADLKAIADHGMDLMRRYERYLGGQENLNSLEVVILYKQFTAAGAKFTAQLQDLVSAETARHQVSSAAEERERTLVKVLIIAGALLAMAIGTALAVFFTRNTISRLAILMDNTVRLGKRESLLPALAGDDEIARLDSFFHKTADDLAEVDRMKQEFVAVISHELRTPLTSLQGTLNLVERGTYGQLSELGQKRITGAETAISRLITLINDLLDIEKMEAGKLSMKFDDFDLAEIIEHSLESVQGFAEQQSVTVTAEKKPAKVLADRDRIVQVLVNLLSNAIKFSDEGGAVLVRQAERDQFLEVQIIDHGAGIPEGFEKTVFEKYAQAHSPDGKRRKGTGLGLPICKAIVEQHGGEIGVIRTEGGGSTFWFTLPRQ